MLASLCPDGATLKQEVKDGKDVISASFCADGNTQMHKQFPQVAGALKWLDQMEAKKSKTYNPVL